MRIDTTRDCMVCAFCHSNWFPPRDADGVRVFEQTAGVDCPVCGTQLFAASIVGCPVDFCGECRGILVRAEAFLMVQASLRLAAGRPIEVQRPSEPSELARQLSCPVCSRHMDTHFYGGSGSVVIDNCPACQLNWLDHGKLQRIALAPDPVVPDEFTWNPTIGFKT